MTVNKPHKSKPHEYTKEEARQIFLEKVWSYVEYWDKESRAETSRAKLEGFAFSMLVILDGGACDVPGYALVPSTHPSDEKYHKDNGESWYKHRETEGDIGGALHEQFHAVGREIGKLKE